MTPYFSAKKQKPQSAGLIRPPADPGSQAVNGLVVTEQVIEYETKKRAELSAHPDNISATEYFTKGKIYICTVVLLLWLLVSSCALMN